MKAYKQFTVTDWVYITVMSIGVALGLLWISSYIRVWVYVKSEPDAPTPMIETVEEQQW